MKLAGSLVLLALLGGCGSSPTSTDTPAATATPAATPVPTNFDGTTATPAPTAVFVGCPAAGSSAKGGLEGIGGTVGQFATDHPQDQSNPAQFGDGKRPDAFFAACRPGTDIIGSVDHSLPRDASGNPIEVTETAALAAAVNDHLMPSDSVQTSATVPGVCKVIVMHSDMLAAASKAGVPSGTFTIELNRPSRDAGAYDSNKVADTLVSTTPAGSC